MKLLDKKTVNLEKAKEKKLEIDEGVKLAKKVATLREAASKEEISLKKFRDENLKNILKEVEEATLKRDSILAQAQDAEARRERALRPLTEEKEEIKAQKEELAQANQQIDEKLLSLTQKELSLDKREKDIALEEDRISDEKKRIEANYADSLREKEQSDRILRETKAHETKILSELEIKGKELLVREAKVMERETELSDRKSVV